MATKKVASKNKTLATGVIRVLCEQEMHDGEKGATSDRNGSMSLVKSKRRVADHGEVLTPDWMVEAMLDLVKVQTERIDSRFLEPASGHAPALPRSGPRCRRLR
jgi:hypothetical protein